MRDPPRPQHDHNAPDAVSYPYDKDGTSALSANAFNNLSLASIAFSILNAMHARTQGRGYGNREKERQRERERDKVRERGERGERVVRF